MTDHTPGPWWVEKNIDRPYVGDFIMSESGIVAETCTEDETDVSEQEAANAYILAAAPELLSSLEDGVVAAQAVIDSWESGNLARAVNDLRTWLALAKETLATAQPESQ